MCGVKGCAGEMIAGNEVYTTDPPRYPHYCNVCGRKEVVSGDCFPRHVHEVK